MRVGLHSATKPLLTRLRRSSGDLVLKGSLQAAAMMLVKRHSTESVFACALNNLGELTDNVVIDLGHRNTVSLRPGEKLALSCPDAVQVERTAATARATITLLVAYMPAWMLWNKHACFPMEVGITLGFQTTTRCVVPWAFVVTPLLSPHSTMDFTNTSQCPSAERDGWPQLTPSHWLTSTAV